MSLVRTYKVGEFWIDLRCEIFLRVRQNGHYTGFEYLRSVHLYLGLFSLSIFWRIVFKIVYVWVTNINLVHLLCSSSSPLNLILFASCWAFFFNRHALDASLFFSFLEVDLTLNGNSLTGVMSLMYLLNLSSSRPILCSFFGLGVKSFPSPII